MPSGPDQRCSRPRRGWGGARPERHPRPPSFAPPSRRRSFRRGGPGGRHAPRPGSVESKSSGSSVTSGAAPPRRGASSFAPPPRRRSFRRGGPGGRHAPRPGSVESKSSGSSVTSGAAPPRRGASSFAPPLRRRSFRRGGPGGRHAPRPGSVEQHSSRSEVSSSRSDVVGRRHSSRTLRPGFSGGGFAGGRAPPRYLCSGIYWLRKMERCTGCQVVGIWKGRDR